MGRKRKYSESYKREAVAKAEASGNVSQTARELGISNKTLHGWIKQYAQPLDVDNASVKELSALYLLLVLVLFNGQHNPARWLCSQVQLWITLTFRLRHDIDHSLWLEIRSIVLQPPLFHQKR